ncbi:MAS20-domain-containing protein [Gloeophyllum trabeum ATCC 11539]|uniref:MAS20-domain-containing protein n=1 Tax=Gloeophyllum trabeum (strain ATCC 11539 / FP-39264 / Madison 617) TaxID=670483 RepID=S7RVZ7_GLOTA|nr:MAS20-domain-containing protein [Gloeophyllum trabeum ATCC 11539]EPQ59005.1 MAS20-domain-containing protein [Gloeophyllum trabeum ATCC 11539]
MTRTSTVLTVAGVTLISGVLAYAVYFDYKRRNDATFRKKLRKEKKKVDKHLARSQGDASASLSPQELRQALEKVRSEDMPVSSEQREQFFMTQVGMGEQLCTQGPAFHLPAALCFYRALRVYPSPVELIVIYQKTVPEPVFKIVMDLMNMDVKERVEGYYSTFPPKDMNVKVTQRDIGEGKRKILAAAKDFKAGDVIYKEQPVVAALDLDLEGKGTHCSHCLRQIQKGMAIPAEDDRLGAVYCSKDCQVKSKVQYQNILFGSEPLLPPELAPDMTNHEERKKAQEAFVEYLRNRGKAVPLLVSKFLARQIAHETAKMVPGTSPLAAEPVTDGDYTLYDHIERLRYLETTIPEEEVGLVSEVLKNALPGIESFSSDERQAILAGKMAYNAIGVCPGGGRDDKPAPTDRPEDQERARTPYGTSRQIGCGLYAVSSYINHSCDPNARPSFGSGTAELTLIANRDIKEGEEITIAYVDVSQHPGETPVEARRRRRIELARGWRFACTCPKCMSEGAMEANERDSDVPDQKDESKVEAVVQRLEGS